MNHRVANLQAVSSSAEEQKAQSPGKENVRGTLSLSLFEDSKLT